jgi:hypothetical protein
VNADNTISMFVTAAVALAAVALTSWLATRRTVSERIWDRRAEAYSSILGALDEMLWWHETHINDLQLGRDTDPKEHIERQNRYREASAALRRVVSREAWFVSDAVQQRINEMHKKAAEHEHDWFDMLDTGAFEIRRAIGDITAMARAELNRGSN